MLVLFRCVYGSAILPSPLPFCLQAESDPLIKSLREELYTQPYHTIPWSRTRHLLANMDAYSPIPKLMKLLQEGLAIYELPLFSAMREPIRKLGLQVRREESGARKGWRGFAGTLARAVHSAFVCSGGRRAFGEKGGAIC